MNKPSSPSADRNKEPILSALKPHLSDGFKVLEIGSGTGQHVCYFAQACPNVTWQPSELEANIPVIRSWMADYALANILDPIVLDVDTQPWPATSANICYTCNTFHIVSMASVKSIFEGCATLLDSTGKLCVYGPFSIDGEHTSAGNEAFDQQLRASNPHSGIRDLTILDSMAQQQGFSACRYTKMPANNLFVVWEKG